MSGARAVGLLLLVAAVFISPAVSLLPPKLLAGYVASLPWTLLTLAALVFSLFDVSACIATMRFSGWRDCFRRLSV